MSFRVRVGPGSVSSKGRVGVSVGPVSASTGGRRRGAGSSDGGCLAVALFVLALAVVLVKGAVGGGDHSNRRLLTAEERSRAITYRDFRSVNLGTPRQRLLEDIGRPPQPKRALADLLPNEPLSWPPCVYYNWAGRPFGDAFRFCFLGHGVAKKARIIDGAARDSG